MAMPNILGCIKEFESSNGLSSASIPTSKDSMTGFGVYDRDALIFHIIRLDTRRRITEK